MNWLTKNWGMKLLSLVLAVGLWNYALGEESVEVTRSVPLKIQIQNPNISMVNISSDVLRVTLSSQRSLLSDMTSQEITAVHEIGKDVDKAGDYTFRVEAREIKLPKNQIEVVRIQPELIRVTLDEVIVAKLRVKPNFVGEPAFGYKVSEKDLQMDPNEVLVQGPKAELEKLDYALTEPIDLVGRLRSFRRTLGVELPSAVKPLNEAFIDTFVPIYEELEEKKFDGIVVKSLMPAEFNQSVGVSPEEVSFILTGSKRLLEKMTPENILAYIDLSKTSGGEHEVPVAIVLPEEISLKDKAPVVQVTIKKN